MICPATYSVRSAGSTPRYCGRITVSRFFNGDIECGHPIRSAISGAGIRGAPANSARIAGSPTAHWVSPRTRPPRTCSSMLGALANRAAIGTAFESARAVQVGLIGRAPSRLFRQREVVDFGTEWLRGARSSPASA